MSLIGIEAVTYYTKKYRKIIAKKFGNLPGRGVYLH
jgi:hypothetical protein